MSPLISQPPRWPAAMVFRPNPPDLKASKVLLALILVVGPFAGATLVFGQDPGSLLKQGFDAERDGDSKTAIEDYSQVLQSAPLSDKVYCLRATAYRHQKDYGNAIADLNRAIQINPKNAAAYNDLSWILATCPQDNFRDGKKAIEYATQACVLTGWKLRATLDSLAAAYAETGDFENAISWENKILNWPNLPEAAEANAQNRLKRYEVREPWRDDQ